MTLQLQLYSYIVTQLKLYSYVVIQLQLQTSRSLTMTLQPQLCVSVRLARQRRGGLVETGDLLVLNFEVVQCGRHGNLCRWKDVVGDDVSHAIMITMPKKRFENDYSGGNGGINDDVDDNDSDYLTINEDDSE